MADENKEQKRTFGERMRDSYRLVILNNETLQTVSSYNLTLGNVYVLLSMLIVVVATSVVLAIAFTPLRRLIPGYNAGGTDQAAMVKLYHDLDSLEQLTEAQDVYNEGFRRMLVGEVRTAPTEAPKTKKPGEAAPPNSTDSKEVEQLAGEVEMEDLRAISGNVQTSAASVNVSPSDIPIEQMYFTPPLNGSVSANFDLQKKHFGVDVIAPKNTAIKSVMDGWVITSDWTLETGNTIAVQHANNLVTFYKHNSVLLKKTGNYVKAGEAIAIIGNTGELTDGPHLHFELWHKGKAVNPADFINFK